jgi:hypothetical protein
MRSSQGVSGGPERGDRDAIQRLIRSYLPLAYNIVGWSLNGYPDIDHVVQAAMIEAFRADGQPGDAVAFRSRIVAACVRQVREVRQAYGPRGSRLPDPDFVKLMVERLGLLGEQREIAQASRWLDDEERLLLTLWWQEAAGTLTRAELSHALRQPLPASARFIAHLGGSLQRSRVVDRALRRTPVCRGLAAATGGWDRKPTPAWRDRIAAHVLDCPVCLPGRAGLSPAEWLLQGLPLVAPPPSLTSGTLRSILDDDMQVVGTGNAQRPAEANQLRPPAKGKPTTRRGVRWSRSSLAAASSGVVLCVLVAAVAAARMNGPSSTASSATSTPLAGASSTQSATSPAPAAALADVKGVGVVAGTGVNTALAASGASWYYNWSATPNGIDTPPGVAFVPMIKGPSNVNTATLDEVRHEGHYLLGFNEPDVANEANLSVNQALDLWPRLEATGMELGSPAVSWGTNSTTGWLGQFMAGAKARGYRVNFITVHWYGQRHWTDPNTNVNDFKKYLEQTYSLYHLPIWITEFSLIKFTSSNPIYPTQAQQAAFLTAAAKMLAGLPFVHRYAWYTLAGARNGGTTILYSDGTSPTAVGKAFKEVR